LHRFIEKLQKQFFNEMLALMPEDMAQDEEVKKIIDGFNLR